MYHQCTTNKSQRHHKLNNGRKSETHLFQRRFWLCPLSGVQKLCIQMQRLLNPNPTEIKNETSHPWLCPLSGVQKLCIQMQRLLNPNPTEIKNETSHPNGLCQAREWNTMSPRHAKQIDQRQNIKGLWWAGLSSC